MEKVDFMKIVSEEDIRYINDDLKGMIVFLDGMMYADEYGSHKNQKESYNALITLLSTVINKINNAAESVDYMHGKLVEFNSKKV